MSSAHTLDSGMADEITEKFKEIIKSNGINDEVLQVLMKDAGLKGEGFASQANCVTIKFANPSLKPLNLFVKTQTTNESHTKFLEDTKLFEKEALFFTKYVPAVREFLQTKGQEKLLQIFPKCYYGDKKMIVLENVVLDRGFGLLDKIKKQDFEAASLALRTLAKHHAISYAYIKEVGGVQVFIEKFPNIAFEAFANIQEMMEGSVEDGIKTNIQILTNSRVDGKEITISALKEKQGIAWKFLMECLKTDSNDPLLLLNHGDYWNNNMLFKRDHETNTVVEHIAVDLQAIRVDSPGADLGYFLFSSVKPAIRQNRLKELLTIYLDTFNDISSKLDHPIQLTYDQLYENFRQRFEFGFWFFGILVATKASYTVSKDIDISKVDMRDWSTVFSALVQKWIENNPEECEVDAKEMVKLMEEYKQLTLK